jgi:hypothetical protein
MNSLMKRLIIAAGIALCVAAFLFIRSCNGKNEIMLNEETSFEDEENLRTLITPVSTRFNVDFTEYNITAGKDTTLIFHSGTRIFIPACAIVNADETPVSGIVKLSYREMSDRAGIIATGIPMKVKDSSNGFLETTGMMEIKAEQDGRALAIKNDCPVKLDMINTEAGTNVNLYYLNQKSGEWETVQKELQVNVDKKTITRNGKLKLAARDYDKMAKTAAYHVPIKPKQASGSHFGFHFKIDLTKYPEVNFYDGIIWEYAGTGGSDDPKKNSWVETARWKEMMLDKTNTAGVYKLKLISANKIFETTVRPVFDKEDMEYAKDVFDYRYGLYKKFVDKKKEEHRKWVKEQERKARVQETVNKISRSFEIDKFGIWNCDRFYSVPNPEMVVLNIDSSHGQKIEMLYLVDKSKVSVIYYHPVKNKIDQFKFEKEIKYKLLALDSEGKIYELAMEECIRKSKEGKVVELKEGKIVSSMKELSEII